MRDFVPQLKLKYVFSLPSRFMYVVFQPSEHTGGGAVPNRHRVINKHAELRKHIQAFGGEIVIEGLGEQGSA